MSEWTSRVLAAIDRRRVAETALELVKIPSPSGDERAVAEHYADVLDGVGLKVELDEQYPESPSVVARTPGFDPERVLQLCGHLDTVPSPHAPPTLSGDVLTGRGSADMKSGMAAIVEVLRALRERGLLGEVSMLVTAYGQHEEPVGGNPLHAPLIGLLRRGIHGTACVIPEGPHEYVPIAGRGLVIFEVAFTGPPTSTHEVLGAWPRDCNPVMAAVEFANLLRERSQGWTVVDPYAGGESYFIGRIAGGDLYNRVPVRAVCEGTRRYPPGRTFAQAEAELIAIAETAAASVGVVAHPRIVKSGQPFRLDTDEPIVQALRRGHETATSRTLGVGAIQYSADASQVMEYTGVPAVYHGTDSTTAHGDEEFIALDEIERCARVLAATAATYLPVRDATGGDRDE